MQRTKKNQRPVPPMVVSAEQAAEVFPAVCYLQVDFEFLQEQLQLIARNQETLQQ
ncbi:MAG: hypothetical protein RLZ92_2148 [Pseudomonadota bacterium]|jgi:hypothetical protein